MHLNSNRLTRTMLVMLYAWPLNNPLFSAVLATVLDYKEAQKQQYPRNKCKRQNIRRINDCF